MTKKANNLYDEINNWLSNEGTNISLIDKMFPNRDGKADHKAAEELMELRQSLYSLQMACDMAVSRIAAALETYEENEK